MIRFFVSFCLVLALNAVSQDEFTDDSSYEPAISTEKLVYLSVEDLKQPVYKNQIIKITYKAIVVDKFASINTDFSSYYGFRILSSNPMWELDEKNKYHMVVYGKITENAFKIPDISVSVTTQNALVSTDTLRGKSYKSLSISTNKKYIGVISNSISVLSSSAQKFNDTHNMVSLELSGYLANFKDINISSSINQGFDKTQISYPISKIFYYAVIPNDVVNFSFLTFNPDSGDFINHNVRLNLDNFDQKISTQMDLNPNKRKLPLLEIALIVAVAIIALVLLIKTRHWIFFVILVFLLALTIWLSTQKDTVIILNGSSVYLLPIKNSTLFYVTYEDTEVTKLNEKNNYIKVILPDKKVGWVKKENVR